MRTLKSLFKASPAIAEAISYIIFVVFLPAVMMHCKISLQIMTLGMISAWSREYFFRYSPQQHTPSSASIELSMPLEVFICFYPEPLWYDGWWWMWPQRKDKTWKWQNKTVHELSLHHKVYIDMYAKFSEPTAIKIWGSQTSSDPWKKIFKDFQPRWKSSRPKPRTFSASGAPACWDLTEVWEG